MPRYLISFDDGAMAHIPHEDLADVDAATRAVSRAAKEAGVWIFGGGLLGQRAAVVAGDGTVTEGPDPEEKRGLGGFAILEVVSHEAALEWAARLAASCRCPQEVREILFDPES